MSPSPTGAYLASALVYFGCWWEVGHHWHSTTGRRLYPPTDPWGGSIDSLNDHGGHVPQGTRYLAHRNGWTALDVTDRTVDSRPGSHSAFLVADDLTEEQMIALAWTHFASIAQRIGLPAADSSCDSAAPGAQT